MKFKCLFLALNNALNDFCNHVKNGNNYIHCTDLPNAMHDLNFILTHSTTPRSRQTVVQKSI